MEAYPEMLTIPVPCWQAALAHALACLPEEACGLFGGTLSTSVGGAVQASVVEVIEVENELHSPVRFRMAPTALLAALNTFETGGLDLLAVFHSHPNGPERPSLTDCAEFAYPGVLSLIAVPEPSARRGGFPTWNLRAFAIDGVLDAHAPVREVPLRRVTVPASS